MINLLEQKIKAEEPTHIGFTIPFPGNLLATLRCAQHLKEHHPKSKSSLGAVILQPNCDP